MSFKSNAPLWEQAPMIRLLVPLMMGIILYDKLVKHDVSGNILCRLFACSIFIFLLVNILSLNKGKFVYVHFICAQILLLLIGFANAYWQDDIHHPLWMGQQIKDSTMSLVVIAKAPIEKHKTVKYEVDVLKTVGSGQNSDTKGSAFVYVYKKEGHNLLRQGDTLLLPNRWQAISNPGNPFEFDYKQHCSRKNIYFQQFLSPQQIVLYRAKSPPTYSILQKAEQYCIQSISTYIKDSTTSALLKAMLLGEEQDIDPQTRQAYSDTGIIHIISISGAHIGLLFLTINFLLRWLRHKKQVWVKYALSLGLIWFYVLLTGASAPALRAAIMFSIMAVANMCQQQNNPLNQLLSAAFIMLLFQPMWLFQIGFQLSFVAVLSLIVFYQPIFSLCKPKGKIMTFLAKSLAASIAAELLIAPLVAYYFHSFPPLFIVANIIAGIAMTGILIMGMVLLILAKISAIAKVLSGLIVLCSQVFHACIYALQLLDIQALKRIFLAPMSLCLLYILIIALGFLFLRKNKSAIWWAFSSLLILSIISLKRSWQIHQQQKFVVFNNGKESSCEYIYGNAYQNLTTNDTLSYAAQRAHINWGITKQVSKKNQSIVLLNNTKILLLDSNVNTLNRFPVDIIVVRGTLKEDIPSILKSFTPQKVVLASQAPFAQVKEWANQCFESKVSLHVVKTDGAFIFP